MNSFLFSSNLFSLTCFPDNSEENQDSVEKNDAEMSKNAQFRAIRPSPSILSFVEDNVIYLARPNMLDCHHFYSLYLFVLCLCEIC